MYINMYQNKTLDCHLLEIIKINIHIYRVNVPALRCGTLVHSRTRATLSVALILWVGMIELVIKGKRKKFPGWMEGRIIVTLIELESILGINSCNRSILNMEIQEAHHFLNSSQGCTEFSFLQESQISTVSDI